MNISKQKQTHRFRKQTTLYKVDMRLGYIAHARE